MLKMIRLSLTLLFLLVAFPLWAEEQNCDAGSILDEGTELAEDMTKVCSPEGIEDAKKQGRASLASYYGDDPEKLCKCLSEAKFNEMRVPRGRHKRFQQFEYDHAIREKLAHSLNDLVGNFTKFNNMILTKTHLGNLVDEKDPVCNIQTLADDVAKIQKMEGTPACPSPKGFMSNRIKTIFGTTEMKELPNKLGKSVTDVPENSCMSNQMYLNMRSNSGASSKGFAFLQETGKGIEAYRKHFHEDPATSAPLKDLLSYDVVFNLAYRDPEFKTSLQNRIDEFTNKEGGRIYDIYNDEKTLKLAYKHLNNSCLQLTQNLKGFLCTNEYPKMNPATLNLHLDDYFKKEKEHPDTKASMRDFLTYDFACNDKRKANTHMRTVAGVLAGAEKKAVALSEEEEKFNNFIDDTILVKNSTKDVFSTKKGSDFSQFNDMFCKYKTSKDPLKSDDLPEMFKGYLTDLQKRGVNLSELLKPGSELSKKLGLAIDPTKTPMFILTKKEDIEAGKLPKINQFKWEQEIAGLLKSKGLPEEEVGQLYAMIEMQTNRRFTEIEDLKKKLADENPGFKQIDLTDIDAIVRKDPDAIERAKAKVLSYGPSNNNVLNTDLDKWVTARHASMSGDQRTDASAAQSVLMNTTNIQTIKDDAKTYNDNMGTFDSDYRNRIAGVNPNDTSRIGTKVAMPDGPLSGPNSDILDAINGSKDPNPSTGNGSGKNPPVANTPARDDDSPGTGSGTLPTAMSNNSPSTASNSYPSLPSERVNRSPSSSSSESSDSSYEPIGNSPSSRNDSYAKSLQEEISRIENQLKSNQSDIARRQRELNKLKSSGMNEASDSSFNRSQNHTASNSSSSYNYPQNVPFKNNDGSYSYPANNISELSSSGDKGRNQSKISDNNDIVDPASGASAGGTSVSGGGETASADGSGGASGGGGAGSAALAGLTGNLPTGRGLASKETEEEARKRLKIPLYEHHKIIPHAIVDVVGSIDKAVILLGLEGMKFKTIEGVSVPEKESTESSVKYFIRTYDFVPEGPFEDYKEDFESDEARIKAHTIYFSFPRTKENLTVSKKFAGATKEIEKEEVTHNYVLQIQNDIMNEKELRSALNQVSEKLK